MTISGDTISHVAEIATILSVGLPVLRKLARIADALENFPLHRHLPGGVIAYPQGYDPPKTGKINGGEASAEV